MPLFAFEGREPQVSPGAWIAPTATLVDTNPAVYRELAHRHAASARPIGSDPS